MQIYKANFENGPKQGNPYPYEMWQNYQQSLILYGCACYREWQRRLVSGERGGKLKHKSGEEFKDCLSLGNSLITPPWLTEQFASNHRSILLGKAIEKRQETGIKLKYDFSGKFAVLQKDKFWKQHSKSIQIVKWYQSHGWIEQPAEKVNNKWPYLWPERMK